MSTSHEHAGGQELATVHSSASLGELPAHLDLTFGGRILRPASRAARVLRALHLRRGNEPSEFTLLQLWNGELGPIPFEGSERQARNTITCLLQGGLLRVERTEGTANWYALEPLPGVPVSLDHSILGVRRLVAWACWIRRGGDAEAGARLTPRHVYEHFRGQVTGLLRDKVYRAFRELSSLAPELWLSDVDPLNGARALTMRAIDQREVVPRPQSAARSQTERLYDHLSTRLRSSEVPIFCLADVSDEELKRLFGAVPTVRQSARGSLSMLCKPRTHLGGRPLLVDLGVFNHRRYVALPEHDATARALFTLLRLNTAVAAGASRVAGIASCPVKAVQRERLDAAMSAYRTARVQVEAISEQRHQSPSVAHRCQQVVRALRSWERGLARLASQVAVGENAVGREVRELGAGRPTADEMPRVTWTGILEEAERARALWATRRSAKALAVSVNRKAHRVDSEPVPVQEGARIGMTGTFALFETRALLISWIGDSGSRRRAGITLRRLGPSPSLESLIAGVEEPSVVARIASCAALGILGLEDALPMLRRLWRTDPEPGVREVASWASELILKYAGQPRIGAAA